MRLILPALAAALLLSGCPSPSSPEKTPASQPTPSPAPLSAPDAVKPAAGEPLAREKFPGVWVAKDEQGQEFEIILFSNGQAVSTWVKGATGARGERGLWRIHEGGVTVFFDDGWTDRIEPRGDGFVHRGFAPDADLLAPPRNESPATRLPDERAGFVGVWRLNKEPDGSYLYVTLQSSGRAFSTIGGGTEGKWELTPEGAFARWPDGWNDLLSTGPQGYQKRSWVGSSQTTTPPDVSNAERVGESKFSVQP